MARESRPNYSEMSYDQLKYEVEEAAEASNKDVLKKIEKAAGEKKQVPSHKEIKEAYEFGYTETRRNINKGLIERTFIDTDFEDLTDATEYKTIKPDFASSRKAGKPQIFYKEVFKEYEDLGRFERLKYRLSGKDIDAKIPTGEVLMVISMNNYDEKLDKDAENLQRQLETAQQAHQNLKPNATRMRAESEQKIKEIKTQLRNVNTEIADQNTVVTVMTRHHRGVPEIKDILEDPEAHPNSNAIISSGSEGEFNRSVRKPSTLDGQADRGEITMKSYLKKYDKENNIKFDKEQNEWDRSLEESIENVLSEKTKEEVMRRIEGKYTEILELAQQETKKIIEEQKKEAKMLSNTAVSSFIKQVSLLPGLGTNEDDELDEEIMEKVEDWWNIISFPPEFREDFDVYWLLEQAKKEKLARRNNANRTLGATAGGSGAGGGGRRGGRHGRRGGTRGGGAVRTQ